MSRSPAVQAVIFDWGGTLTPWRTLRPLESWRRYADVLHRDAPERALLLAEALRDAEATRWRAARDRHLAFTIADVVADATADAAAGANADVIDDALIAYRASMDFATHTDPHAGPMLRALRSRGLRTGVLSSTSWPAAWHVEILRRDGVADLFDGMVWSSDLTHTKPHPTAFAAAVAAVGAEDPARCVYVGDRPYEDVSGAKAVGMRAVLLPHSDIPPEQQVPVDVRPDAVIQSLAELPGVLDRWNQ